MNLLRSLIGFFVMSFLVSTGAQAATSTYKPKFKFDAQKDLARYKKGIKYYPVLTADTTMFADPEAFEKAPHPAQTGRGTGRQGQYGLQNALFQPALTSQVRLIFAK